MRPNASTSRLAASAATLALLVSCAGDRKAASPTAASPLLEQRAGDGTVAVKANNPPTVVARVEPAPSGGVLTGKLPFDVKINLCQSSDPDPGDSIRFDVSWGDGVETGPGRPGAGIDPANDPTGCEGADCCRHRHRFDRAGSFQVEARVSDKHLEDQSRDVSSLAISRYRFTVNTGAVEPSAPSGPNCTNTTSFVGNLNGISINSTFETGVANVALPTQGWTTVSGTAQTYDGSGGLGGLIGGSPYGNYQVQYDTGVAIQPSTTYTLSVGIGYIAGLGGGNSGYSLQLGTLSGGIFTGLGSPMTGTVPYAGNLTGGIVSGTAQQVFATSGTVSGQSLAVRWAQTSTLGAPFSDFFGMDSVTLKAAACK